MQWKKIVIFTLCFVLLAAPAYGFVAAWIQRAIIIAQQLTQIGNEVDQIKQFKEKLDKAKEQIEMVKDLKDSVRDGLNGLTEPFTSLVSAPTELVGDTMGWGSEFTGDARRTFDAARDFGRNARSLREGWRTRLSEADQVGEADILDIYRGLPPEFRQEILDAWKRRRQEADSELVHDHTLADAAAALAKMLKETQSSIDKLRNQNNTSATALGQAQVTGQATQAEILTAIAQLQAWQAARDAAKSYSEEIKRRNQDAALLASEKRRAENKANVTAAIAASAERRRQANRPWIPGTSN